MGKPNKLFELREQYGDLEQLILGTLRKHKGIQKDAAAELGVSPSTISTWLRDNGFVEVKHYVQRDELKAS